jgi:hypothetical protein
MILVFVIGPGVIGLGVIGPAAVDSATRSVIRACDPAGSSSPEQISLPGHLTGATGCPQTATF